ncbi:hypothetical protein HY490_01770 [Candidatus Woesearchaeota archaeon]|nr:hypothetical protein [Candidatus Woesearchaeota archaeon]
MESVLEEKIQVYTQLEMEKIVQEVEEHMFLYLGRGFWYSRSSDRVYRLVRGKLQFVADYSK